MDTFAPTEPHTRERRYFSKQTFVFPVLLYLYFVIFVVIF